MNLWSSEQDNLVWQQSPNRVRPILTIPTTTPLLLRLIQRRKTKMLPILNLLNNALQPIPDTLHRIRPQNQP